MKPSKSTIRKIRSRGGKLSIRHSSEVRHRAVSLKLESLEQRTLLSGGASAKAALPSNANAVSMIPVASTENLSPGLLASVKDANTVATVAAPSTPVSVSSAATSHIYTGQPALFTGSATGNSSSASSSTPAQDNPKQVAALGSLTQSLKYQPQYLVMPTTGSKEATPDNFLGPAGYSPAQIIGAYGIVGNGAGQTIAVVDAGDYTGFVNSTDPNFDSSALHVFDQEFGLPDPPSFTKYNQSGQTSPLPSPQPGWCLEIALDVEWAHAMAPDANIDLVEATGQSPMNLGTGRRTRQPRCSALRSSRRAWVPRDRSWNRVRADARSDLLRPGHRQQSQRHFPGGHGRRQRNQWPDLPLDLAPEHSRGRNDTEYHRYTWESESAWSGGGGGPSDTFPLPILPAGRDGLRLRSADRSVAPDVAADADPSTGVSVYDPVDYGGWVQVGGTSVATPITVAMIAIADAGPRGAWRPCPWTAPARRCRLFIRLMSRAITAQISTISPQGNNFYPAGPGYDLGDRHRHSHGK